MKWGDITSRKNLEVMSCLYRNFGNSFRGLVSLSDPRSDVSPFRIVRKFMALPQNFQHFSEQNCQFWVFSCHLSDSHLKTNKQKIPPAVERSWSGGQRIPWPRWRISNPKFWAKKNYAFQRCLSILVMHLINVDFCVLRFISMMLLSSILAFGPFLWKTNRLQVF